MRLLVCGSRDWKDYEAVRGQIVLLGPSAVVHGGARGADRIAGQVAEALGIPAEVFPAQWRLHGLGAGYIRNRQMLVEGKPDYVLAFHDDLEHSKGTRNMIARARVAGIPVEVWSHSKEGTK